MDRVEISEGITRVKLLPGDGTAFETVLFEDDSGVFLSQTGFRCQERPVYRLKSTGRTGSIRQTANGEVADFEEEIPELIRMSHSAEIRFSCPDGEVLTGLGQHEEGIFDYARKEERLYQHNMKIAIPFLLSSAGLPFRPASFFRTSAQFAARITT